MRLVFLAALFCEIPAGLAACGDDDDDTGADGDVDADADTDGDGDGDGGADADADADSICALPADRGRIQLDVLVDGREVTTCEDWRLRITACADPTYAVCAHGTCNRCASGDIPADCDLGDACEDPSLRVETAGDYTVCITAELPNGGGVGYTGCGDVTMGNDGATQTAAIDVDTQDQFPCIADWQYDPVREMCCDDGQGYCVPPGAY